MASRTNSIEDLDAEDFPGRLLHQAALWDNAELLEDLLNSDQLVHLNSRDSWGRTALHAAAPTEGSRCLRLLLQAGALADIPAGPRAEHKTALHMAAETGAVDNIQTLLQYSANLLARDTNGCTPLDLADKAQHTECCTVLKQAADARELARQELHGALREACSKGDVQRARALLRDLGDEASVIINSAPNGANTLLFKSCEEGHKELVRVLLEYGADDRIHPVTKYSPLYIAAYYGRKEIAEMLLKRFPNLVAVCTVEKWLPIHACIINGHHCVLTLLLTYPYPQQILQTFRDKNGRWQYQFAFDCNQRDVTGQSALYLASYCANIKMVEMMLKFKLPAEKIKTPEELERERIAEKQREEEHNRKESSCEPGPREDEVLSLVGSSSSRGGKGPPSVEESGRPPDSQGASSGSPTKSHRISGGIHALMSKLNLVRTESNSAEKDFNRICPFDIDLYCNSNTETALHVAVKNKHHSIVSLLLGAGANPNLRIYLPDDKMAQQSNYIFTGSTALVEACRNHDLGMVDMLLKNHARDDQCKALYIAAHNNDTIILSKLLALKAHPDPEYKIHKRCLEISPNQQFGKTLAISSYSTGGGSGAVYAGICPTTPVMINWHGQRCLPFVKDQWLVDAAVQLNPKLRLSPRSQVLALYAITRLDISNNALTSLPQAIFSLPSLRILNAGQNKIEELPGLSGAVAGAVDGCMTLPRRGKGHKSSRLSNAVIPGCTVSVLEEIHLQDNRLDYLPEGLFSLPALQHLDVSNNKLTSLPYKMWSAPKLRDLNLSLNLLSSLPLHPDGKGDPSHPPLDEDPFNFTDSSCSSSSHSTPKAGGGKALRSVPLKAPTGEEESSSRAVKAADERVRSKTLPATSGGGRLSLDKHGNVITCCRQKEVKHYSLWTQAVQVQDSLNASSGVDDHPGGPLGSGAESSSFTASSCLQSLNLSHNAFSTVPLSLPCLAVQLTRLNLSYNRLTDMGPAWHYPSGLKQLDLSHNNIATWPNLALYIAEAAESEALQMCYAVGAKHKSSFSSSSSSSHSGRTPRLGSNRSSSGGGSLGPTTTINSTTSTGSSSSTPHMCLHRRHHRLEGLKTLVLADNQLTRLCLYLEDGVHSMQETAPSSTEGGVPKGRLVFPSLSMLDVSNNCLKDLPSSLHHMTSLAVLNISGNTDIQELPPEMGLLSRMWNLNTRGCSLQDPLKTMIESKKYKTMDVIGYLKSILEDARPYARMKLMIVGVAGIGKTSLLDSLRQEGTGSYRRKPVEHWAARMGNRNINTRTSRGGSMSTVGVDIGDWTYEKKVRGQSNHGPVTFRTWDFGGQKEYYATHQYFLSKRSLYLVVWKIIDGEKAIDEILQWLVNIQARAPNSAVLIIGTHYDLVKQKFPASWSEDLQQIIRDRFINVIDADKLGLPRVLDTIEVSCKTRHNVKLLCNLVYDTVFSLKTPGSKERLLEQRIPASYLALEDVVCSLALERRLSGRDPVLSSERYQALVATEMTNRGIKPFRDVAELNQATTFLHENGVLLHYDDATLKELYFLDPQWLCDMLAHVVTIREINPFAKNGLMKLDDLKHVFKTSSCAPVDAKSYIVSLLNKFEVALTWDNRTLLIPSLLPSEEQINSAPKGCEVLVRIPLKSRGWVARRKRFSGSTRDDDYCSQWTVGGDQLSADQSFNCGAGPTKPSTVQLSHRSFPLSAIRRLLLMSYFPSGFWPRFITRILADEAVVDLLKNYFVLPKEVLSDAGDMMSSILGGEGGGSPEWVCWQTGLELHFANTLLIRISEKTNSPSSSSNTSSADSSAPKNHTANIDHDYKSMRFLVKQEGVWSDVEIKNSAVLEIILPNEAVVLKRNCGLSSSDVLHEGSTISNTCSDSSNADLFTEGIQSVVLDPAPECVTKLLAIAVDHIDTLLEDWYPTLGTRFVHTSEGKFLITRLLPCPVCLECQGHNVGVPPHPRGALPDNWGSFVEMNPLYCSMTASMINTAPSSAANTTGTSSSAGGPSQGKNRGYPILGEVEGPKSPSVDRASLGSRQSLATSDGDSGVGPDSNASSRNPSAEGPPSSEANDEGVQQQLQEVTPVVYSFLVEECILAAYSPPATLTCPLHSTLILAQIAPDTVFLDLGDHHLVTGDCIKQGKLLGRGGFGFVFQGSVKHRVTGEPLEVALKMLQPVDPGHSARQSAIQAYKACVNKWERDPLQYACKAYCSARQEVNILLTLKHPNIVPFVGVCPRPLAIVLELAPQGALDHCLKHYQRSGARLRLDTLQALILQVAKALEYLHGQHIIYRDLKSENVLVWELPSPFCDQIKPKVDVKLADYGISRASLPTGTKGFGGTEGFMAPEMMRFNGEEEYTDKVDVFSFGMFVYELLTTHQPYEHCDNVKELVLEGDRPALSRAEIKYPLYLLDLMVLCWNSSPRLRPSASQVVSIATAPEFPTLMDVTVLDHNLNIMAAVAVPPTPNEDEWSDDDDEDCSYSSPLGNLWISRTSPQLDMLGIGGQSVGTHSSAAPSVYYTSGGDPLGGGASSSSSLGWTSYCSIEGLPDTITAMCCVGDTVWLGDNAGFIHGYSSNTTSRLFSYCLEPDSPSSSAVRAMTYLHSGMGRVAVALSSGRVFVCSGEGRPHTPLAGEGSFVLTELASESGVVHCLAVTLTSNIWKLWCGGSNGSITVYTFRKDGLVTNQESVSHSSSSPTVPLHPPLTRQRGYHHQEEPTPTHDETHEHDTEQTDKDNFISHEFVDLEFMCSKEICEEMGDVLILHAPDDPDCVAPKLRGSLWSYVYPGCVVYHWNAVQQKIVNRLDCSKLVPCSESLQSISIEEHLSPSHCQVSAMAVCGRELYVGTTWGCVIVAEASSMRPITVFRPYQDEVRAILPVWPPRPQEHHSSTPRGGRSGAKTPTTSSSGKSSAQSPSAPVSGTHGASSKDSLEVNQQPLISPSSLKSFGTSSDHSNSSLSLSSSSSLASGCCAVEAGVPPVDLTSVGNEAKEEEEFERYMSSVTAMVVTLGRGYRNLLARYAPMPKSVQQVANSRQMYALLWRANEWNG